MGSCSFGIIAFIFLTSGWPNHADVVRIKQGALIGTTMVSRNGTEFNAFLGVPYATPPVGKLRFQPPEEAQPWNGTFNATHVGPGCVQKLRENIFGEEDCLNINVYTPKGAKAGDNITVIVYIFGGTFKQITNFIYKPQYLMDHRIIIAVPNYRLGVLGFLTTGDSVISGNMGLKDQNQALKWVRDNIYSFGGDPNRVTLYGHSSGAMCVHLHTLSPLSAGLFNRVIIQSGTGVGPSAFFDRKVAKSVGQELARRVGCDRKTSKEILRCLLKVDANLFPEIQEQMYIWDLDPDAAFRPTEEVMQAKSPFLTSVPPRSHHPVSNYEWLIGTTSGECAFKAARYLSGDGKLARQLDHYYRELFPITLQYLWTSNLKYDDRISVAARNHYFGDKRINDSTAVPLMNIYTDEWFIHPTVDAIRHFDGTKYVYLFDYWSNYSAQDVLGHYFRRIGISHSEDLHLIFYHKRSAPVLTDQDKAFGSEMITRWVNFATSGNPNKPFPINESMFGSWEPVESNSSRIKYLRIKLNGTMEENYGETAHQFWKNMPIMSEFFSTRH